MDFLGETNQQKAKPRTRNPTITSWQTPKAQIDHRTEMMKENYALHVIVYSPSRSKYSNSCEDYGEHNEKTNHLGVVGT